MNKLIAPSILSADFSNLGQQIRFLEMGKADWIHCDIMDGHFVPNISFGPLVVESLKKYTNLFIDSHLMITQPEKYIKNFADAGSDLISIHSEACTHLHRNIELIKSYKVKAGVVINPATPVSMLENILEYVDLVLVMSVNPGFGGQKFIDSSLTKISKLANLREEKSYNFLIQVDGGVCKDNIKSLSDAGCDVFVVGSAIFNSDNITASALELKKIIL